MGAIPQQGSIASETRSLTHPAATNVTGCRIQHSQPLPADAYQCQPDNSGAVPGILRQAWQWGNPQLSDGFSRSGERIGYDAQSLPPV